MTQTERRKYLTAALLKERAPYADMPIPEDVGEQKRLLRALLNVRMPRAVSDTFAAVQDAYLQEETRRKGVTDSADLPPVQDNLYLWQGDLTALRCDAIVNAANTQMLGCFCPNHGCLDNAVHTFAGVQLRLACAEQMKRQGHEEQTGGAKITPAFNLPCDYVIHTVGPIVRGRLGETEKRQLSSCYRACLELADRHGIKSVAFPCISTGEFHFPNDTAAQIAVKTVREYQAQTHSKIKVIFNVFKDDDYKIYRELLGADRAARA